MTYGEIIVSVLIMALILLATWLAGRANPVGTGKLVRRIDQLEVEVKNLDGRMDGLGDAVTHLTEDLTAAAAVTRQKLETMQLEAAGDRALLQRTSYVIFRIQDHFMDSAVEQSFRKDRP